MSFVGSVAVTVTSIDVVPAPTRKVLRPHVPFGSNEPLNVPGVTWSASSEWSAPSAAYKPSPAGRASFVALPCCVLAMSAAAAMATTRIPSQRRMVRLPSLKALVCAPETAERRLRLRPRGVAAHAVEQQRGEAVGELVRLRAGADPGGRPVRGGEHEERGRAVVEVGAELAVLAALAEEGPDPLLIAAALGDERIPPLALEVAPLAHEDGRHVVLRGDHAQMGAEHRLDPVEHGAFLGDRVERGVERLRPFPGDLPEQVGLAVDMGVERALLQAEGLGEVADRGAVVALLGEEPGGGTG